MADLSITQAAQLIRVIGTGVLGVSPTGISALPHLNGETRFARTNVILSNSNSPQNIGQVSADWSLGGTGIDNSIFSLSGSVDDTVGGTGVQSVKITYLDENFNGPYTEIVSLNGTTLVTTVNSNLCFIDKIEPYTGTVLVGSDLLIYHLPDGTYLEMQLASKFVLQEPLVQHWIPAGKTCYITNWTGSHENVTLFTGGNTYFALSVVLPGNYFIPSGTRCAATLQFVPDKILASVSYRSPLAIKGPAKIMMKGYTTNLTGYYYTSSLTFYDE
jgi:hypothetical protein